MLQAVQKVGGRVHRNRLERTRTWLGLTNIGNTAQLQARQATGNPVMQATTPSNAEAYRLKVSAENERPARLG